MEHWEMKTDQTLAARVESQKAIEETREQRPEWIEDEVEELERWDGLE